MSNSNGDGYYNWDWAQSEPKDKFGPLTEFSVSNADVFQQYFDLDGQDFNNDDFNKKAQTRLRNKVNAKNSRDRRKNHYRNVEQRISQLESQNRMLRSEKLCKRCRTPYNDLFMHFQKSATIDQVQNLQSEKRSRIPVNETRQIMEFQKPNFQRKNQHVGKIWIAIAILMLIIGLRMHGVNGGDYGNKGLEKIEISKGSSEKWFEEYKRGQQAPQYRKGEEYFNMKMRFQETMQMPKGEKQRQKPMNINPQIVIEESDREFLTAEEEEFKIHKEFIYNIGAQIEDIGRYL